MENVTNQLVFNHVVKHLLTQNSRSVRDVDLSTSRCAYRGKIGMCAVGCLIPDELYTHKMEQEMVIGLLNNHPELESHLINKFGQFDHNTLPMLVDLQHIHDQIEVYNWPTRLQTIAEKNSLTMPEINT